MGGGQTVSPSLADEGALPASQLGGTCDRCGRSFVKREEPDGFCLSCSRVVKKGLTDGPPARRPEAPSGAGGVGPETPTCSVDDCCRVPHFDGLCKTHLDARKASAPAIDKTHPWNQYVEKKTEAWAAEVVKEEPVIATKKRETLSCDECDFTSDWPPAMANHKRVLHGPGKKAPAAKKPRATAIEKEAAASSRLDGETHVTDTKNGNGVAHRDVKPENVTADMLDVLLDLAALEPDVRKLVLETAARRWG